MNNLKTLSRIVKKQKAGHIIVTSTIEATMTEQYVDEQLDLLKIHKQRSEDSLNKINSHIEELEEIKNQFS